MEENQIVVVDNLLESIAHKLHTLRKPNKADNLTIFHVPYKFRQSMENLFEPFAVSIGPLHRGKPSLKAMEEQKWLFLRDFLSRGDGISLNLCLSEIKRLEERTRRCYSESVPLDSNSFVEMMLLDGCFVLEYFLKWDVCSINTIGQSVLIFSDLLLLENQIPFFIVEKLFEIGLKPDARIQSRRDFTNHLAQNFAEIDPELLPNHLFEIHPPDEIHHLVHLRYHSLIPINPSEPVVSSSESFFPSMLSRIKNLLLDIPLWVLTRIFPKIHSLSLPSRNYTQTSMVFSIPCATELENAGIRLRPKRNPNHMLDISFKHGVLKIPTLIIHNDSKTLLANLVAFEQYKLDKMSANLSSFAMLLDSLVNTPEDVMILQQCGIIKCYLDSDKELIDFFNQINKETVVEGSHFLAKLFVEVNSYCKSTWGQRRARWNRHKKQFIKDYFSSPWTAISLVAGVFVVLLTFVQAVFAVLAYFVPPS